MAHARRLEGMAAQDWRLPAHEAAAAVAAARAWGSSALAALCAHAGGEARSDQWEPVVAAVAAGSRKRKSKSIPS